MGRRNRLPHFEKTMRRRTFLATASAGLAGLTAKAGRNVAGGFVNDAFPLGHRIRDRGAFAAAKRSERVPIVIVGGGMAGLSAAWRLHKKGFRDFVVLEMEAQPGGNSRWGENEITAYPWAAHYVPVPDLRETLVREIFEDLGVLQDGKWDERRLCFSPQERLYLQGRWQDGVEPEVGASARDHEQYRRFNHLIEEQRATGQFTIPMERGARESHIHGSLDAMTMTEWMAAQKFDSPYLNWYIDYACRDDYGALARDTSAWAGIHYFASRDPEEKGPLTWPEGNGWIARRLIERLQPWIRAASPVYAIERDGRRLRVRTEAVEYSAERVIFAAPTFLAAYVVEGAPHADGFVYSPWLTANLTLDRLPEENGFDTAWDNVIYDSPALGYVVATHMSLRSRIERSVWTFYWALAHGAPRAMRQMLLDRDWPYWREEILRDLARAHKDIRECVSRIDVMRMGHAMARPVPGFLGSESRRRFAESKGPVYYANSDLSGFSIFEEAQYRGVAAADRALKDIGKA
jgi:glycine/D-amino acid oxidase-like deaminating enzyme